MTGMIAKGTIAFESTVVKSETGAISKEQTAVSTFTVKRVQAIEETNNEGVEKQRRGRKIVRRSDDRSLFLLDRVTKLLVAAPACRAC
jgi:hypothetical protein